MASKHQGRRLRRPKFSTVIALFALFAALGGSAYAAKSVINGKDIKKGTVTSKAVKDGTLKTKDLSDKAQSELQGQQGPKGPKGDTGAPGADGVVEALTASRNNVALLPDGIPQDSILTLNGLTGGTTYVVNAKARVGVGSANSVTCTISRNGVVLDTAFFNPADTNEDTTVPLQAVVGGAGTSIVFGCATAGGGGSSNDIKVTAIPVA